MDVVKRLVAEHDKDPVGAARDLRELDAAAIEVKSLRSYSWLLNHVLGELEGAWTDAAERQQVIAARGEATYSILLNYTVAALNTGWTLEAWNAQRRFSRITEIDDAEAELVVRLNVLQYSSQADEAKTSFLEVFRDVLGQLRTRKGGKKVAPMIGSCLNNIVSSWLERPADAAAPITELMLEAAVLCQEFWQIGGTWINVERACYLRALAANHAGIWDNAREAAQEGIAEIEKHGEEDVDRAFLLLELARAYGGLSQSEQKQQARNAAVAIADTFSEPDLRESFDSELAKKL